MARLRVLISGAGVAGNALAFWLSKLGHEVTVVERFPGLRVNGLQLDLRGHGIQVLKRMGLEEAFRSCAAPEQGGHVVDSSGKRWAYFPANKSGKGAQTFTSEYEIMRGDLCRIMYDVAVSRGTRYLFGTTIESFDQEEAGDGGSLEVRFADGSAGRFDLLVGADGQGSRTRKLIFGSDADHAVRPLDECIAYFTIPRPVREGEKYDATFYIATGGRFLITRRHNPHRLQVYMTGKTVTQRVQGVQRGDVEGEKAAFAEVFRGAGWQTDEILDSLDAVDDFYCERLGLVKLDAWSRGCATLLGDAAYCPTSQTGLGTTSAMVGAYVLAGEIGRRFGSASSNRADDDTKDGLQMALKAYEDRFRPFMDVVQKGVGDPNIMDKIQWTPFAVYVTLWVMWLASTLRLDLIGTFFLDQGVKEWDLPDYEELLADEERGD